MFIVSQRILHLSVLCLIMIYQYINNFINSINETINHSEVHVDMRVISFYLASTTQHERPSVYPPPQN